MRMEAWRRRLAWRGGGGWGGASVLARPLLAIFFLVIHASANLPLFDVTARMRVLLVPSDTAVGSVIYRLRATDSDFDYPLHFDTNDVTGRSVVVIRDLPCSRNKTHCSANVHLRRSLREGVKYDFRVSVTDSSGDSTVVDCTLRGTTPSATAATAAAFPRHPGVVFVPEDAKIGSVLDYIIARKNPKNARHVHLEIMGSDHFSVKHSLASPETVNATLVLDKRLDFEEQVVYRIQVLATDPYVDSDTDTRNIAGLQLEVAVVDVQDTPPHFLFAPPTTHLNASLVPGDVVLKVKAEDGDRGTPRGVRYGLLSRGNPFTPFFRMDETSGELSLARPLKQLAAITQTNAPVVVLTVLASEIVLPPDDDPENSEATAQVALILENLARGPPRFESNQYVARIPEGSSQGTALQFLDPWIPRVKDDDMGRSGFFSLSLENDNGTFEISPSVAERSANFVIQVKNNRMLDYENHRELSFKIVAAEVASGGGTGAGSSTASATVYIDDVNDHPPVFLREEYSAELPENATAGTSVVQVQANDVDTGSFGRVSYTRILGPTNTSLSLDSMSGIITVASNDHAFDREAAPEHRLYVEARDEDGTGLRATVPLTIRLLDINDEEPMFTRAAYEFFLDRDGKNFTSEAYVEAIDKDSEPPNNVVRYEIVSGNYENKFSINAVTGRITLREPIRNTDNVAARRAKRQVRASKDEEDDVIMLNVRAYDLGVPHRWSQAVVRVYPRSAASGTRLVLFVVPRPPAEVEADRVQTERILSELTGGRVTLSEIRPHQDPGKDGVDKNKSDILAQVLYPANAVVDVHKLTQQLISVNSSSTTKDVTTTVLKENRAESSALFWLLLFFALFIVIVILILFCCCWCEGCPLYGIQRKRLRIESQESLRPVVQETAAGNVDTLAEAEGKAEEAGESGAPREAWSAEHKGHQSRTHRIQNGHRGFRRSSVDGVSDEVESLLGRGAHSSPPHSNRRRGPSLLYSRRLQQKWADEFPVYLEDVEDTPGRRRRVRPTGVAGGGRRVPRRYLLLGEPNHHGYSQKRYLEEIDGREEDTDSMRRHELERGSDHGGRAWAHGGYRIPQRDAHALRRDVFLAGKFAEEDEEGEAAEEEEAVEREGRFVREGDAEILRLVTRGGVEEDGDVTGAGRGGKEILLRRFMEDQDEGGTRRKEKGEAAQAAEPPPPPPPPPVAVATQTDSHAQTQTEPPPVETEEEEEEVEEVSVASSKGGRRKKHHVRRSRSSHRTKKSKSGVEVRSTIVEELDGESITSSNKMDIPHYLDNKSSILRKMIYRSTEAEPSDAEPSARSRRSSEVVRKSFSEMYRSTSSSYTHHHPPPFRLNTGGSMSDGEGRERRERRVTRKRRGSLPESSSRYMDWYKELVEAQRRARRKRISIPKEMKKFTRRREWTHDKTESVHRVTLTVPPSEASKAGSVGGGSARVEDDIDSGIAMSQATGVQVTVASAAVVTNAAPPSSGGGGAAFGGVVGGGKKLLEKKSVFDIAYDDMHTKQLRADSISPPY